ncbi:aldolase/citrate lyase family protein [Streptomyces sp. NBC_01619]|uniref:HpcH/HpaI aldolase family protein n=1 Tax=Streptomyces sp. NBC_01619 TaxID=2975901 RepID=UPI00225407AB|nr:aldolase/citrate lyase family protein [Streptomyces sp. NBC_01619]MCX4516007.1 aldolase/citrate lyase family protein [Streptomyces sp. NBC_01619]
MSARALFPCSAGDRRSAVGTIVTLPDSRLVEIAAQAGCDWVMVDCEHGAVSVADVGRVLVGAPQGFPVLVRVPAAEEVCVKQALDAGAAGIVCPMVEDAATVKNLVRWAKYAPVGARSVGIGRAHGYGLSFDSYLETANAATSVVVQIESAAGVGALDGILGVEYLGGVLIGPYDLSASMGQPGEPSAPAVLAAVADVVTRCNDAGVPVGQFFASGTAYTEASRQGQLDFAAIGLDTMTLSQAIRREVLHLAQYER